VPLKIIEGVTLHLAHPDELQVTWVGQEEPMRQLLAAWLVIDPQDLPMNPRLLGKPGVGKTTLAYAAAKRLGRESTSCRPRSIRARRIC
jgi:MoxR-like ATPase